MDDPIAAADYQARRAAEMNEAQLQSVVIAAATRRGWLVYHTHDSRRSQPGFPDLVLVHGTRVLFRELKTQKGQLRPEQRDWLFALERAHADAAVWRPADWFSDAISNDLNDIGRPAR